MSAGGLSYSALTNHGKLTLPSVSTWGTNMNILRDPPKSITTRRINKVGETSSITEMIDESGDRACEAIRVYARGVNPFVSVSYSNYGNNGGQSTNNGVKLTANSINKVQSKLPYRILVGGAFRPPVLRQENLMPLSRQPRCSTTAFTQPGFTDFSRKLRTCTTAKKTREVKTNVIKTNIRPTATYNIQPVIEPFEIKYEIKDVIKNNVSSRLKLQDNTQKINYNFKDSVIKNPIHAKAISNISDKKHFVNEHNFDSKRYIQDVNPYEFSTNLSSGKSNNTSIDDIVDLSEISRTVQDIRTTDYETTKSGNQKTDYIHKDVELFRNLPEYETFSNKSDRTKLRNIQHTHMKEYERNKPIATYQSQNYSNIRGPRDHGSRDISLAPKLNLGGYGAKGVKPGNIAQHTLPNTLNQQKRNIAKSVLDNMFERYSHQFPRH